LVVFEVNDFYVGVCLIQLIDELNTLRSHFHTKGFLFGGRFAFYFGGFFSTYTIVGNSPFATDPNGYKTYGLGLGVSFGYCRTYNFSAPYPVDFKKRKP